MKVGNGASTKFWTDGWLNGCSIKLLAPCLFACVPKRRASKRTIQEALTKNRWLETHIGPQVSVAVLCELLDISDICDLETKG